jgi:hypothetical protein
MATKLVSTGVTFPDGSTQTTALDASGVTAGSYGSASAIPTLTIDANGIITSASTASVSVPANCSNCSSYTNLTDKPSIPSNCSNCSGDVNGGTSPAFSAGGQCTQCADMQCSQCTQCYQAGNKNSPNIYNIEKTGTSLRMRGYQIRFPSNCY